MDYDQRRCMTGAIENFSADAVKVNLLYVVTSLFVVFPFIISIYGLLYMYQNADLEFGFVKSGIAVIELFLGAAFTMYIDSLFGKSA